MKNTGERKENDSCLIVSTSFCLGIMNGVALWSGYEFLKAERYVMLSFSAYIVLLSFFHFFEYFLTAKFHPATVAFENFLIPHSREYTIATLASLIEFVVEVYFGLKFSISFFFTNGAR